jgi:hypothetical protein
MDSHMRQREADTVASFPRFQFLVAKSSTNIDRLAT